MKKIAAISILLLLLGACSEDKNTKEKHEANQKTETVNPPAELPKEEIVEPLERVSGPLQVYRDSIMALTQKSVLDYYYLLPSDPFFDREVGEDNLASRKAGLRRKNVKKGFLIGGHEYGPSFNMALFRGIEKDYLLLGRVQTIGEMFEGFFRLMELRDGNWVTIPSEMTAAPEKFRSDHPVKFAENETVVPLIPEHETTVKFIKCKIDTSPILLEGELLFSYTWDKKHFSLKKGR